MKKFILLILLITSIYTETLTGDATEYTPGFTAEDGAKGFACGFRWLATKERKFFAALPGPMWEGSANCGRCAKVTCTDPSCDTVAKGRQTLITIVDQCPECKVGDLDFSKEAWNEITNNQPFSRKKISWEWVPCDPLQDDSTLRLTIDPGANPWYYSGSVSNSAYGVKNAILITKAGKSVQLTRRGDNYWFQSMNPQLEFPYKLQVTDHNGKTFTSEFSDLTPGKTYLFSTTTTTTNTPAPSTTTTSTATPSTTSTATSSTSTPTTTTTGTSTSVGTTVTGGENVPPKNGAEYIKSTFILVLISLIIFI
jgi:hypothetical protein